MSKNEENSDEDLYKELDKINETPEEHLVSAILNLVSYPADIQLQGYHQQWNEDQFDIPTFQRNYIWDKVKASRFIESFLLGLPVPAIFLYKKQQEPKNLIIDGQQRVISIVSFLKGKFIAGKLKGKIFSLKGVREQWDDRTFTELDEDDQFRLNNAIMRATMILLSQPGDEARIYDIFRRLNTGGVTLNPMEIRLCIGESKFTKMLKEVNRLDKWRAIIQKPINKIENKTDDRFRDVELILRFFALEEGSDKYKKPMKIFLDTYIDECKNKDKNWVENKKKLFEETIDKALLIREDLFKIKNKNGNIRFSIPALESILVALAGTKSSEESLKNSYKKLITSEGYIESVTQGKWTTDDIAVKERIRIAKEVFQNA